tara:strand:+ start:377 stop:658 length:282 start_codon:yes stop_codon:yes gene_type:complete
MKQDNRVEISYVIDHLEHILTATNHKAFNTKSEVIVAMAFGISTFVKELKHNLEVNKNIRAEDEQTERFKKMGFKIKNGTFDTVIKKTKPDET